MKDTMVQNTTPAHIAMQSRGEGRLPNFRAHMTNLNFSEIEHAQSFITWKNAASNVEEHMLYNSNIIFV